MQIEIAPRSHQIERPRYVWVAVALELLTGVLAIPVGFSFIQDPTGLALGLPGMLVLAALSVRRHWIAPWLTGILSVGLIIWITVEVVTLPDTMVLTWVFLTIGIALGFVALFWLRRTRQMVLW